MSAPSHPRPTGQEAGGVDRAAGRRLSRVDRIRRRSEFLQIQSQGRRVHTPHFVVMLHPAEHQRIGITVTRRVAGAVGRNRIKRLVREVFRTSRDRFPAACDVVVVARQGAERLEYAQVEAELLEASGAMLRAARPRPEAKP